ncbi:MAG: metal-dependent hydrolase [Alcanivorax jadensis]|jgi:predicted metal-dependent hydrolase|uniref:metal-dependent hydrolase n=1 Tax=Alcanivorax TaxID=59753 RepID=UPI000C549071|nr:metal-dependent hydrolase [Alcanivorax jadensis]MBG33810.1 metal-dependent hydrolase [Alcanivorax sp.]MDF1638845.1 metal-dependent hydrolase [Alcanivorax jadensis]|tara:strand:+ start:160 stop:1077 length:918 start_codon:yes stop_codon:yes gene_type:complete
MNSPVRHQLKARRVQFDFDATPLHWLKDDPFSTHIINGIHLLLPAGELWFCRVYNQALPLVTDDQLRADVEGFIRQEAVHSRAHSKAQLYLERHGLSVDEYVQRVEWLFGTFLGEAPFGMKFLQRKAIQKQWLVLRVGLIAAIEHFTGVLGQWAMDNDTWEENGDPAMVDLFKWHLAEEVEHRTVAFDLFEHLCKTQLGFYVSRQALMAIVFPLFIYFISEGGRSLARQDPDPSVRKMGRTLIPQLLMQLEQTGKRTENVPTFTFLVNATLRWLSPRFHPIHEGDTEQALAYLARSPAAKAAAVH